MPKRTLFRSIGASANIPATCHVMALHCSCTVTVSTSCKQLTTISSILHFDTGSVQSTPTVKDQFLYWQHPCTVRYCRHTQIDVRTIQNVNKDTFYVMGDDASAPIVFKYYGNKSQIHQGEECTWQWPGTTHHRSNHKRERNLNTF